MSPGAFPLARTFPCAPRYVSATRASHDVPGVDLKRETWLSPLMLLVRLTFYGGVFSRQRHTSQDAKEQADRITVPRQLKGCRLKSTRPGTRRVIPTPEGEGFTADAINPSVASDRGPHHP